MSVGQKIKRSIKLAHDRKYRKEHNYPENKYLKKNGFWTMLGFDYWYYGLLKRRNTYKKQQVMEIEECEKERHANDKDCFS